ncbi:MAG: hypothetical protein KKA05_06715, partial [Alphaproteobacteria bacterium]|nr:hypothetical protein [Alphaproteobacteria bacterium]
CPVSQDHLTPPQKRLSSPLMKRRPDIRIILIAAAVLLASAIIYYATVRLVPDRTAALLTRYGFTAAKIDNTSFHGDSFAHSDIQLDPDGFSTIRALRIQPNWMGLLGGGFIDGLIVDDMRLTGELTDRRLTIAGWTPRLPPFPRQNDIIINGLRLDLNTDYGSIRMETKGRLSRAKDGTYKTEAILFGRQHQLTIDSKWVGNFNANGAYALEGEIAEANIKTSHLEASRASGWLQIASELATDGTQIMPALSGQLQIGRLSFNGVPLGNATITMDGPLSNLNVIMNAIVPGLPDTTVNADITRQDNTWQIKATVATKESKDMLAFMVMLRQNLEEHEANTLTSFLITPGNIERLRREMAALTFDTLELQINGPVGALHGSLIAKTMIDGRVERYAISLDPGKSN